MTCNVRNHRPLVVIGCCLFLPILTCCFLLSPLTVVVFAVSGTVVRGSASVLNQPASPEAVQAAQPKPNTPLLSADAANGARLFSTFQPVAGIACSTCHRTDSQARLVGPGLLNARQRAQTRVKGMSVVDYLRESIVRPGTYIVEGYTDIMPKNWGRVFSEKQIDDLIAYLLTLEGSESDAPTLVDVKELSHE